MSTLRVDILNPKALKLLKGLAELNLITIHESPETDFADLLKRLRKKEENAPSLEEITKEVELVRAERYAK